MSEGPTIGDWTQYGWIPGDASSFPATVRLRNTAWMVYYEPDVVVQRMQAENAKLRKLVRELWEGYNDPRCDDCPLKDNPACVDCPICAREAEVIDRMRELGVEVDG